MDKRCLGSTSPHSPSIGLECIVSDCSPHVLSYVDVRTPCALSCAEDCPPHVLSYMVDDTLLVHIVVIGYTYRPGLSKCGNLDN